MSLLPLQKKKKRKSKKVISFFAFCLFLISDLYNFCWTFDFVVKFVS